MWLFVARKIMDLFKQEKKYLPIFQKSNDDIYNKVAK